MNDKNISSPDLVLELGDKCNNNCIFCSVKNKKNNNLSTYEAKKRICDAKKRRFRTIQFSGGEPTLRKDIIPLVSYAKKLGFESIGLTSNARLFSYKNFAKRMIDAGCDSFAISIYSHNTKIHDACTRTPGSFEDTVKGLRNILKLKKKRTYVKINFLLNKININSLGGSISWLNREFKDINLISLLNMHPVGEAKKHPNLMFRIGDYGDSIDLSIEKSKIPITLYDMPFCSLKNKKNITDKKGYYDHSAKNIRSDLRTSLNTLKTKLPFCKYCDFDCECQGIWKSYVKRYGYDEFTPIIKNKILPIQNERRI